MSSVVVSSRRWLIASAWAIAARRPDARTTATAPAKSLACTVVDLPATGTVEIPANGYRVLVK